MRWKNRRQSSNVDDRRGQRMKAGSKFGIGGIIMAVIAIFVFKQDPLTVLSGMNSGKPSGQVEQGPVQESAQEKELVASISTTLADTEDTWQRIFQQAGQQYPEPTLVLYRGATGTACGTGQAASGPFYCPGDQQIYLDLSFLNELNKMGATGDFALAYVIAHEVGHHIQTVTGTSNKVRQQQSRSSKAEGNALQVKMELQADCYAGIWASKTQARTQFLEHGDIEEALGAASAVGDDTIMKRAGMPPRRESFTHGSSKERMEWFARGYQTGDVGACNTGI